MTERHRRGRTREEKLDDLVERDTNSRITELAERALRRRREQ